MGAQIDIKVEIAFNAGYRTPAADRIWTDVTEWVEAQSNIAIAYGRADELATADAVRLSGLLLDNSDGRFTAGRTASPYYPDVKVGRPIRITATAGDYTSTRFTGYVDQWPTAWPGGTSGYATAAITASSRLSRLGLDTPRAHPLDDTVVTDMGADYYWPLTESSSAAEGAEYELRAPALVTTSEIVTRGVGGDPADAETLADLRPGVKLTGLVTGSAGGTIAVAPLPVPLSTDAEFTIGLAVTVLDPGPVFGSYLPLLTASSPSYGLVGIDLANGYYTTNPATLAGTHYLALVFKRSAPTTIEVKTYLDGAQIDATSAFAGLVDHVDRISITAPVSIWDAREVVVGRLSAWSRALTPAELEQVSIAGRTAFAGDSTDNRLRRYAQWAHIPLDEVVWTPSPIKMAAVPADGGQIVSLMRQVETTEAGVLHDDRQGRLVLQPRRARYGVGPTIVVDASEDLLGRDYAPKVDRQGLANIGRGTNADDTVDVTYTNEESRQEYGDATYTVETHALDPDEPLMLAAAQVNANAVPRPRAPSATLQVLDWIDDPQLIGLLELDIGSRIALRYLPDQAPETFVDYFVEGYTETLAPWSWSITANLSPGTPTVDVFVLDDPEHGVLDQNVLAL